jgi:hypothetical protein
MSLDDALISKQDAGNQPGYSPVISPDLDQPGWMHEKGGHPQDLLPFKGYGVIMENGPDTLLGFSTTSLS